MQFKSREGGIWAFGQRRTIPEPDSLWAVNPASFQWGWVCWGDGNKILGEKLVPISQPLPDVTKLPDKGFPWQQEMAVNLKCVSGTDAGTEVVFKTNTEGGKGELVRLIEAVRDRLSGQHDGKVVADRATRKLLLPASAVRQDLGPAADRSWIGCRWTARRRHLSRRLRRRRRLPSSRVAGALPDADVHLRRRGRLQRPRLSFLRRHSAMFNASDLIGLILKLPARST